ncbi:transcriptional regulator [Virgisporangium aliadipatigenens]|uniref:Transcriptional regulator n=1 Tax=Virgisporangium aliadipatigenens TaxID=741659 RepID=A0A8J3YUP3_9ACTN|nr:P-loop NTPase [Virgisporangium aliadipatigenens]GIJ50853.1 transcriptional regulator [Virgisporangium aliadipatigenens]
MILYFEPQPDRAREYAALLGKEVRPTASLGAITELVNADKTAQLVLLGSGVVLPDALNFAKQMRMIRPSLGVVLLRDHLDVTDLAEALRAGIREVVLPGDVVAVREALARSLEVSRQLGGAMGTAAPAPARPTAGRLITVFAGKGGCGKSTMATNLAVALAGNGAHSVLLMDLDLSFGDVAIMLQLAPERSMVDAVGMTGRLDETGLRSLLTPFAPGVDALLAPAGPADGERVNRDLVSEIIKTARKVFDFIVVDTPPFFSDQVLAALDVTDHYILLATPDIPSLKNLRLTMDMFDLLEYPKDERIVVLNRADSHVGLTPADIERVVRAPIQANVPSTRDVPVSINQGVPLMVKDEAHPVSKAIKDLAVNRLGGGEGQQVYPATAEPAGNKRRPFLLRRGAR